MARASDAAGGKNVVVLGAPNRVDLESMAIAQSGQLTDLRFRVVKQPRSLKERSPR